MPTEKETVLREWHTGAIFSPAGELISKGEVVIVHGLRAHRRWWQFWKPKSWALPPQRYVAGDWETAVWSTLEDEGA
jgi:hypothetical protein